MSGQIGKLYVVATPIGNLEDLSPRARRILSEVQVIACEDTRHTGLMLKRLSIERGRLVAYHDRNERRQALALVAWLKQGLDVALVTNAGTPLISDPGYRLVSAARAAKIPVIPIPGPCALIAALSVSGLATDRFTFYGFMPSKPSHRSRLLKSVGPETGTAIFYIPARMLLMVLNEINDIMPTARLAIARELTKVFEEVITGTATECLEVIRSRNIKGEVTLLLDAR